LRRLVSSVMGVGALMDLHEVLGMAVTDTIELEESVRRMTPIAAPREQRASVLALMELLHHVDARHSGVETYRLISPTGKEVAIPESVFVLLERITEVLA